jgi:hypothetical protein
MDEEDIPWGDPDAVDRATADEFDRIQEAARIPLFQGSTMSTMEATTILLNILREGGAPNVLISQVFAALHRAILPQPNTLPDSEYAASDTLRRLGLSFQTIHACPNGCVLFRGRYQDSMVCPKYMSMRMMKRGNTMVPQKVLRYFPLIPRLKQMFRSPLQATAMTWHSRVDPRDTMVHHASQGKAWAHINNSPMFDNFRDDPRNLRLGLATDGINPFSEKRSIHSTWPVLLLNYNMPPWMTTKKYFVMLSLLIPGPDVYIAPLVDELRQLWSEGVLMRDAAAWNGRASFILRAMVIWTIHNLHAYGLVAGCTTKGYRGCPVCGPHTLSRRSAAFHKNVYDRFRGYLPEGHSMRDDVASFGNTERAVHAGHLSGEDFMRFAAMRQTWLSEGNTPLAKGDPVHRYGVKRLSVLYTLPYWKVGFPSTFSAYRPLCLHFLCLPSP